MRQVIQSYRTGDVVLTEVPAPRCGPGSVLIRNRASLISLGTERSTIELGKKSLIDKARARPDLVKRVIEKARRDGLARTYAEAMGRLDAPTPLGYSCAGEVIEAGAGASVFKPGDRVACIGQGFASHAEFVSVPANLVARIDPDVTFDEAAFGMLGVIALHGVRSARLEFGARVAVLGLGLLGLLTVQILRAYGCRVICMDPAPDKIALALTLGADAAVADADAMEAATEGLTDGFGCDAVIICASTTSAEPVNLAVKLSRPKGRIVVVGVADLHPDRNELWLKEVDLVVSRAGGPGSLDPVYEQQGIDLPIGEVRWTENRNLAEFLRLIADKRIDVRPLITHRYAFAEAERAYAEVIGAKAAGAVGVLLEYAQDSRPLRAVTIVGARTASTGGTLKTAVIGAGLFARSVLLPALVKVKAIEPMLLVASSSASAGHTAKRFGFPRAATDMAEALDNPDIDALIVATPHSHHAAVVQACLAKGKALFIEKPLCVDRQELDAIRAALSGQGGPPILMVGHNRRYSPHTAQIRRWLAGRTRPLVMTIRINAGFVPADHWVHSAEQGRSRIVGEMTHFLDLACAITGSRMARVMGARVAGDGRQVVSNDNLAAVIEMVDGSVVSLAYSAQGSRAAPREQIEIWSEGEVIASTDFTRTVRTGRTGRKTVFRTGGAAAGYKEELERFAAAATGGTPLETDASDAVHVMEAALALETAVSTGEAVEIDPA
jgi:predicted dehydrogenase